MQHYIILHLFNLKINNLSGPCLNLTAFNFIRSVCLDWEIVSQDSRANWFTEPLGKVAQFLYKIEIHMNCMFNLPPKSHEFFKQCTFWCIVDFLVDYQNLTDFCKSIYTFSGNDRRFNKFSSWMKNFQRSNLKVLPSCQKKKRPRMKIWLILFFAAPEERIIFVNAIIYKKICDQTLLLMFFIFFLLTFYQTVFSNTFHFILYKVLNCFYKILFSKLWSTDSIYILINWLVYFIWKNLLKGKKKKNTIPFHCVTKQLKWIEWFIPFRPQKN